MAVTCINPQYFNTANCCLVNCHCTVSFANVFRKRVSFSLIIFLLLCVLGGHKEVYLAADVELHRGRDGRMWIVDCECSFLRFFLFFCHCLSVFAFLSVSLSLQLSNSHSLRLSHVCLSLRLILSFSTCLLLTLLFSFYLPLFSLFSLLSSLILSFPPLSFSLVL